MPTCPQDYSCSFTLVHPRTITTHDVWWHGPAGIVVALAIVVALTIVLVTAVYQLTEMAKARQVRDANYREIQDQRKHDEFMAEQRTMQVEQAKGDPDMLKIIERWR